MRDKTGSNKSAVLIEKEEWLHSMYTNVWYDGKVTINGYTFLLIDKDGKDYYQMSVEAAVDGESIDFYDGKDRDLVRVDFVKSYRRLGRRRFIAVLDANKDASPSELKEIFKYIQTDYSPTDGCQVMR